MQNKWEQGMGPSNNQLGALKRPDSMDSPPGPWLERESQTFSWYREGELGMKGLWLASGIGQLGFTACLRGEGQRFFPGFMTCFRREGWREGENNLSAFAVFSKVQGPYWKESALIPFKCKTLRMLGEHQCPLRFLQQKILGSVFPHYSFSLLSILVLAVAAMLEEQTQLASNSYAFALGTLSWS